MPSPSVVTATAEWVVTGNWARASELRLGGVDVEVAGRRSASPRLVYKHPCARRGTETDLPQGKAPIGMVAYGSCRYQEGAAQYHRQPSKAAEHDDTGAEIRVGVSFPIFSESAGIRGSLRMSSRSLRSGTTGLGSREVGCPSRAVGLALGTFGEVPGLREADLVCCVSEKVRNAVIQIAKLPPHRVIVTPNTAQVHVGGDFSPFRIEASNAWGVSS